VLCFVNNGLADKAQHRAWASYYGVCRRGSNADRATQPLQRCLPAHRVIEVYTCEAISAATTGPSLKTCAARPGHVKIALVITAVDFDQFSHRTDTSLFSNDNI